MPVLDIVGEPLKVNRVATGRALATAFYPFLPADLVKLALAAAVLPTAWRFMGRA